jgi:hypothetical protein
MQNSIEYPSTSIESFTEPKKKKATQKTKKKFFEMRNIIKKVKTHGLKCFSKCLLSCMKSKSEIKSNWKISEKKQIYKLFKSDICKSRNRAIINQPMKEIMKLFSNIKTDFPSFQIRESMALVYSFLLNMTWGDFLKYLKNENGEVNSLIGSCDNTLNITSCDVRKYYEYINQGVDYRKRSNVDDEYVNLFENLSRDVRFADEVKSQIEKYFNNFCDL